jgi:ribosomal protein S18 acetylase RimI-like enzyme
VNFPAQELYQRNGYKVAEWIHDYYRDEKEDALFMICDYAQFQNRNEDEEAGGKETCVLN